MFPANQRRVCCFFKFGTAAACAYRSFLQPRWLDYLCRGVLSIRRPSSTAGTPTRWLRFGRSTPRRSRRLLCRGTRCCCGTKGCRTSTAIARARRRRRRRREACNPRRGCVEVLEDKRNSSSLFFVSLVASASISARNFQTRRPLGFLKKPRRARVQLRLLDFSAGARRSPPRLGSRCRVPLWSKNISTIIG